MHLTSLWNTPPGDKSFYNVSNITQSFIFWSDFEITLYMYVYSRIIVFTNILLNGWIWALPSRLVEDAYWKTQLSLFNMSGYYIYLTRIKSYGMFTGKNIISNTNFDVKELGEIFVFLYELPLNQITFRDILHVFWLANIQFTGISTPCKKWIKVRHFYSYRFLYRVAPKKRNSRYSRFFRTLLWSKKKKNLHFAG